MSYLRWGPSRWYVFWKVTHDTNRRDEQVVSIDCEQEATYGQLKADLDAVVNAAMQRRPGATTLDHDDLVCALRDFMRDVESDVGLSG